MPAASTRPFGPLALLMLAVVAAPALAQAQTAGQGNTPLPNPLAPRATGPQPTLAPEEEGRPPPPPRTQEPMEEIQVIAPRRVMPDFQTVDEFHRAEFERLRAEFERPAAPPPRAHEVLERTNTALGNPNDRSAVRDIVRGARPLRDTLSGGPPLADPTP